MSELVETAEGVLKTMVEQVLEGDATEWIFSVLEGKENSDQIIQLIADHVDPDVEMARITIVVLTGDDDDLKALFSSIRMTGFVMGFATAKRMMMKMATGMEDEA